MLYLCSIFNISVEFQDVEVHQSWEAKIKFRDNVSGRKLLGKNGFIMDSISTDSLLIVFYSEFYFVAFSGKYHGKCLPILYAYLNSCH